MNAETTVERVISYQLADGKSASVALERSDGSSAETFTADLLELSRSGTKLAVSSYIPFGEAVRLTLAIDDLELELSVLGEVCWILPSRHGNWLLGCSFNPELPEEMLTELADEGHLERRGLTRHHICLPASASWELGETETPVTVQNYSSGGICILTDQPGKTGHRLLLHVDKPDGSQAAIPARVQWLLKISDGYLVGCEFLDDNDFYCLREIVGSVKTKPRSKREHAPLRTSRHWKWMIAGLAAGLVALGLYAGRDRSAENQHPHVEPEVVAQQSDESRSTVVQSTRLATPDHHASNAAALPHATRCLESSARKVLRSLRGVADEIADYLTPVRQRIVATLDALPPLAASQPPLDADNSGVTDDIEEPGLVLLNPRGTEAEIHYTIDGNVYALRPGEVHRLDYGQGSLIRFHRGGSFGDVTYSLAEGTYVFRVSETGWELVETPASQSDDPEQVE